MIIDNDALKTWQTPHRKSHETSQICFPYPVFLEVELGLQIINVTNDLVSELHSFFFSVFFQKKPRSHGKICSTQSSNGSGPTPQIGAEFCPGEVGFCGNQHSF